MQDRLNAGDSTHQKKPQERLSEDDWKLLLGRINEGRCTPFVGAGACHGVLPLGDEIAQRWADDEGYPLDDCADLAKVSQFLVTKYDAIRPKDMLKEQIERAAPPDFDDPNEPHRLLADLPLPIYITTNYDDFLLRALSEAEYAPNFKKAPMREVCRWNKSVRDALRKQPSVLRAATQGKISVKAPLVFHLHGHTELIESMVVTEDDYLDFLVNISSDEDLLPPRIQQAMTGTSLLFIGYRLSDWNFRVLFRSVVGYLQRSISRAHISVQLVPVKEDRTEEQKLKAQAYLQKYFGNQNIRVYWGTAADFAQELRERWTAFKPN